MAKNFIFGHAINSNLFYSKRDADIVLKSQKLKINGLLWELERFQSYNKDQKEEKALRII